MSLPALRRPTTLGTWDPLREFEDLHRQMDRLFSSAFGPVFGDGDGVAAAWRPLADIEETDDAYLIDVDLPGVKRDDVEVEAVGDTLRISGEFKERERTGLLRTRTRRVGRFEYRMTLPGDADPDGITADLADGVLRVTVPRTAAAKPRRIPING